MAGTIVAIIALTIVLPVGIIATSSLGAFLIGLLVNEEVDARHEGSELLEVSKSPY